MSFSLGTRRIVVGESPKIAAAIRGSAAFFDPLIAILPLSGVGPLIMNLSTWFYF
jgi:hypothetical protein